MNRDKLATFESCNDTAKKFKDLGAIVCVAKAPLSILALLHRRTCVSLNVWVGLVSRSFGM